MSFHNIPTGYWAARRDANFPDSRPQPPDDDVLVYVDADDDT